MLVKSKMVYRPEGSLELAFEHYANGRKAIQALIPETGEPYATLTVNLPEQPLGDDFIIVKGWSENQGAVDTLRAAYIIEGDPVRFIKTGFVQAPVFKLAPAALTLWANPDGSSGPTVPPAKGMTAAEFLRLPPVTIDEAGHLHGLVFIGKGNVYAALPDAHGDNFLISTPLKANGSFSQDVEGTDWVEVEEGLGALGELL